MDLHPCFSCILLAVCTLGCLVVPFAVTPFARWVARLLTQIHSQELGLFETLQFLVMSVVEVSLVV